MSSLRLLFSALLTCVAGCTPLSHQQRPAPATLDCAHAVLRTDVPEDASDQMKHCLASAHIARRCSVGEAYLLGLGKEIGDAVGPGDLEWRDWQANRLGVRCARTSNSDEELRVCCAAGSASSTQG